MSKPLIVKLVISQIIRQAIVDMSLHNSFGWSMRKNLLKMVVAFFLGSLLADAAMAADKDLSLLTDRNVNLNLATPSKVSDDEEYRVGAEDVLEISVWKEESLKKEVLVKPDGSINFPLAGEINAAGKTSSQIQAEIAERISKYIPDPVVTVAIMKVASYRVYVLGRVQKPGEYSVGRNLNVLQALSMAGGLTPYAAEDDIHIMRKTGGKSVSIPFEYSKVQKGKAMEQNIILRSGDVLLVP